jgi:hypothetical protein
MNAICDSPSLFATISYDTVSTGNLRELLNPYHEACGVLIISSVPELLSSA